VCPNLVGLKERCRGICVALQNNFPDPPGDSGWYNVLFMPWFEWRRRLCSLEGMDLSKFLEIKVGEGVMTVPGTSSQNLFHGGLSGM